MENFFDVRYLKIEWIGNLKFYISEQSHREAYFGHGNKGEFFLSSNKVLLYSAAFPEIYRDEETDFGRLDLVLACRGSDERADLNILKLHSEKEKQDLLQAVKEYNMNGMSLDEKLFEIP